MSSDLCCLSVLMDIVSCHPCETDGSIVIPWHFEEIQTHRATAGHKTQGCELASYTLLVNDSEIPNEEWIREQGLSQAWVHTFSPSTWDLEAGGFL